MVAAILLEPSPPVCAETGNPGNLAPDTKFHAPGKPTLRNANYQDHLFAQLAAMGGIAEVDFSKHVENRRTLI
jgi:putative membrane protein